MNHVTKEQFTQTVQNLRAALDDFQNLMGFGGDVRMELHTFLPNGRQQALEVHDLMMALEAHQKFKSQKPHGVHYCNDDYWQHYTINTIDQSKPYTWYVQSKIDLQLKHTYTKNADEEMAELEQRLAELKAKKEQQHDEIVFVTNEQHEPTK